MLVPAMLCPPLSPESRVELASRAGEQPVARRVRRLVEVELVEQLGTDPEVAVQLHQVELPVRRGLGLPGGAGGGGGHGGGLGAHLLAQLLLGRLDARVDLPLDVGVAPELRFGGGGAGRRCLVPGGGVCASAVAETSSAARAVTFTVFLRRGRTKGAA
jgi:hypothetical protein